LNARIEILHSTVHAQIVFTAMLLGSVGALIPFLASFTGTEADEYSNIYKIIAFAMLAGTLVQKALGMYKLILKHHTILVRSSASL
jgi:hypothetical protein